MNARNFKVTAGAVLTLGLLAALPAQAGGGLIKITHSDTPYRVASQPAPKAVAQTKPVVSASNAPEVQVAVMAAAPTQKGQRRSVFIHR